jgi:hypothetical protein
MLLLFIAVSPLALEAFPLKEWISSGQEARPEYLSPEDWFERDTTWRRIRTRSDSRHRALRRTVCLPPAAATVHIGTTGKRCESKR